MSLNCTLKITGTLGIARDGRGRCVRSERSCLQWLVAVRYVVLSRAGHLAYLAPFMAMVAATPTGTRSARVSTAGSHRHGHWLCWMSMGGNNSLF